MNSLRFLGHLNVGLIANMSQCHNPCNVLSSFDKIDGPLNRCHWVLKFGTIAGVRDVRCGDSRDRDDSEIVFRKENIGNQGLIEGLVISLDVARCDREG